MPSGLILGIESSCDETAAAVVGHGTKVISNVIASQVALHANYGGVVPELASREHLRNIVPVVRAASNSTDFLADAIALSARKRSTALFAITTFIIASPYPVHETPPACASA